LECLKINLALNLAFYLLCTADLPISLGFISVTYTDDTAVFMVHNNRIEASSLQESFYHIQRWRLKNEEWSKKMENQNWNKICVGDIYYSQKDVSTGNSERFENPSS